MSKLVVYFVQIGTDGYLPDSTSAYPTLEQAISAARDEKKIALDSWFDNEIRVTGNIRRDWRYEVICDGTYRHSIRVESYNVLDCGVDDFSHVANRAMLETACDEYNQNN